MPQVGLGVGGGMIAAIVPAAGSSARMGEPKLLLPIGGAPAIVRVIEALRHGGADRVIVVAPPRSTEHADRLAHVAASAGAETVFPDVQPADMRASIECGLRDIKNNDTYRSVLISPGDAVGLDRATVAAVIAAVAANPERLVVPSWGGKRGHPLALPRGIALSIATLPPGRGVNAILEAYADRVLLLPVENPEILADLDTPEDYRLWIRR